MWKAWKVIAFNNKTWIINIQYTLISCIILAIVILFDTRMVDIQSYIPEILLTKVGLASTILSALAGALLSMTVFTFSTIMTIVSFYSSNYTSSTIDDFIKSDIILKVLGIFIGGFFYSVTALLFMRETYEHDYVIAGSVGVIYALVCVVFFIRFVQQILYGVQSTNLIKDIYEDAFILMQQEVEARKNFSHATPADSDVQIPIHAQQTGYVSAIHYEELSELLVEEDMIFEINTRIGEFTVEGAVLGVVYAKNAEAECEEFASNFVIQDAKIPEMDYQYRKSQLIDITLKSLPPGKPDLNNAIHCIRKLSVLMAEFMRVDGQYVTSGQASKQIIYKSRGVEEELYMTYNQIIPAATQDISVVLALLDGFYTMQRKATEQNKQILRPFVESFYKRVHTNFDDVYDQRYLQKAYEKFEKAS